MGWIARSPRTRLYRYCLIPFSRDRLPPIFIDDSEIKKFRAGLHTIVRAEIIPTNKRDALQARILEVLPDQDDPNLEVEIVAQELGFPTEFSKEVGKEVEKLDLRHDAKRVDLKKDLTVTIDGETAKDFDDAIHVSKRPDGGYLLKVSIADVSHFVRPKTRLNAEAFERGTSIYLPDRAIPMLPERLSNDLCSLRPREERFCLTCEMHFDHQGRRQSYSVYPSVIESNYRLTYTEVWNILSEGRKQHISAKLDQLLRDAYELSQWLERYRMSRGALDLDIPEREFAIAKNGDIEDIFWAERNPAHKLIEHFMVAANEAVAEFLESRGISCLYRIHERPDPLKIERLEQVLKQLQVPHPKIDTQSPMSFQKIIHHFKDHEDASFFSTLILRSMKQAQYSPHNAGHFGLGSDSYCHFTSPIRRYPDLFVHRALRQSEFGKRGYQMNEKDLMQMAELCNQTEQRSVQAERIMEDIKEARWAEKNLGQKFKARIVSVKEFGFFVETQSPPLEGLVSVHSLPPDRWKVDALELKLSGRKGRNFHLGDRILVQLVEADRLKKRISFKYLNHMR